MFNAALLKSQFPALLSGQGVYLDNAATTQVPEAVLEAMAEYDRGGRGNPYRGLHRFSERATVLFQSARLAIAQYIGAQAQELLFTKSTTEGLNLLARALGSGLGPGDEVVLSIFEHHANLLPWRELANERGFKITYLPMGKDGAVNLEQAVNLMTAKVRVLAVTHASNVLGTILPVSALAKIAHEVGAWVIVDGSQTAGRLPVSVSELGVDTFVFGAHKMYGPEGVGAVYVSENLRPHLKPLLYGGGMVNEVLDNETRYAEDLRLFEAGTPNVSGALGFAAACQFLAELGLESVFRHELDLSTHLMAGLSGIQAVRVFDPVPMFGRVGIVSFSIQGIHSHDVAQLLADQNIAVRAGYHCAAPLTRCLDANGTVRASFGVYNTLADVERLIEGVQLVMRRFQI